MTTNRHVHAIKIFKKIGSPQKIPSILRIFLQDYCDLRWVLSLSIFFYFMTFVAMNLFRQFNK